MKYILTSSLSVILFVAIVLIVYWLYFRLWIMYLIKKIKKKPLNRILTKPSSILLHIFAGIGILCFLYGLLIEPYWLEVTHIEIQSDKLKSESFRIVQLSDMHCDTKIRLEEKVVETVNSLQPDILVFTGDSLNTSRAKQNFQNTLRSMHASLGQFAITGNWDFHLTPVPKLFDNTGFTEIDGMIRKIDKNDDTIQITGSNFENGLNIQDLLKQADKDIFTIFLYHSPDLAETFDPADIDLYLCGHTHGGQIALPFYGAITTLSKHGKKYEAGLYHRDSCNIYVNRGIGMEGGHAPRVRFWARPEIAVFDIVPLKEK
jgi:predicted MPP superfamily phosphohydrolase